VIDSRDVFDAIESVTQQVNKEREKWGLGVVQSR
jgi:hypothetical protein